MFSYDQLKLLHFLVLNCSSAGSYHTTTLTVHLGVDFQDMRIRLQIRPYINYISLFGVHSGLYPNLLNTNSNMLIIPQDLQSLQIYLFSNYQYSAFYVLVTIKRSGITDAKIYFHLSTSTHKFFFLVLYNQSIYVLLLLQPTYPVALSTFNFSAFIFLTSIFILVCRSQCMLFFFLFIIPSLPSFLSKSLLILSGPSLNANLVHRWLILSYLRVSYSHWPGWGNPMAILSQLASHNAIMSPWSPAKVQASSVIFPLLYSYLYTIV